MKSTITKLYTLTILSAVLLIAGCDSKTEKDMNTERIEKEAVEDLTQAKKEMTSNIDQAIASIDEKLKELDKNMDNATAETKERLNAAKKSLTGERSKLEKMAEDVAKASESTWSDVKDRTQKITTGTKESVNKIADDLTALFKKDSI